MLHGINHELTGRTTMVTGKGGIESDFLPSANGDWIE